MGTVPTGTMERELRKLYLSWVRELPNHQDDLYNYIGLFQRRSTRIIEQYGGRAASLGALAGFPAPRLLELSPVIGYIYDDMRQAAIQASIAAGLNANEAARALLRAGVDKSFRKLQLTARTETVRAYWRNSWNSIEGLGLVMLWSAESGPRTCEWCLERDGMVVESSELRDHPNGRCTLLPTLPQRVNYRGSVTSDGTMYYDPDWRDRALSARNPSEVLMTP